MKLNLIPSLWLPACGMSRVICHWTAGSYEPSLIDAEHYHLLLAGDGSPHRGEHSIADNVSCADDDYAAHTRGCNTGSIGVSVCAMRGAVEHPLKMGSCPVTAAQWNNLILAAADLCQVYQIPPDRQHLLMHCEVERFLGRPQKGKWDISVLFHPRGEWARLTPGDELRARVKRLIGS